MLPAMIGFLIYNFGTYVLTPAGDEMVIPRAPGLKLEGLMT